ncbi:MAG: MATE family efflux transporter, partial [Cellulosilyticaceae bacterium]
MTDTERLGSEKISRLLLRYAVPAILTMLVTSLYNTVDRAFIGSIKDIGGLAISGLGVTMPLFTLIGAFCVSIAIGGSTNISIKLGEGNREEAEEILGSMVALACVVGVMITVVGILFLDQILLVFGASQNTLPYARDYMSLIMIAAWFNLPGFALNSAMRAEGNPKLAAKTMILGCFLNIVLDPILIFGLNMGIKGAALGTILCQLVICLWGIYYFTRGRSSLKLQRQHIKINKQYLKIIVGIGMTPFFMELAAGSIHLVTNRILGSYGGDLAIGAMTTITSIGLLFLMPVYG